MQPYIEVEVQEIFSSNSRFLQYVPEIFLHLCNKYKVLKSNPTRCLTFMHVPVHLGYTGNTSCKSARNLPAKCILVGVGNTLPVPARCRKHASLKGFLISFGACCTATGCGRSGNSMFGDRNTTHGSLSSRLLVVHTHA